MNIYVDHKGEIDIWALSPQEKELVGKNTEIRVFLREQAKKVEKLLVIDRNPENNLVALLLGKDEEGNHVHSRELYKSKEGYSIIWLPWDFQVEKAGYDSIITLNPPYSEAEKTDESS